MRDLWTVRPPAAADGYCPLDRTRAADAPEAYGPDGMPRVISAASLARRQVGRRGRPQLFGEATPRVPPQELAQIAKPAAGVTVPFAARGKIAVVKADAIGAGTVREAWDAERTETHGSFHEAMEAFRNRLAGAIEAWAVDAGLAFEGRFWVDGHKSKQLRDSLRLDVLVWGGDDMTFVLPAYRVFPFLSMFMRECDRGLDHRGRRRTLPHRIGCAIVQQKVPIRQSVGLARSAEEALRPVAGSDAVKGSVAAIDVFESASPAHEDAMAYRVSQYGRGYDVAQDALTTDEVGRLEGVLRSIGQEGGAHWLTLSQTYRALQRATAERRNLTERSAAEEVEDLLVDHLRRIARAEPDEARERVAALTVAFSAKPRPLPLTLAMLAQLHPYAGAEG
jgi:hypothetical protein